jgi:hypothetical protein
LTVNDKNFLSRSLQPTSIPVHLLISPEPNQLLTSTPSGDQLSVIGPIFPGDAIVGVGGKGTFGAYLYPINHLPGEEKAVWGLTCGHVATEHAVTPRVRGYANSPTAQDLKALSHQKFEEFERRHTEFVAEIEGVKDDVLSSHSVETIDHILSMSIYNDFDELKVELENGRDAALNPYKKEKIDKKLMELEECRTKRKELERIKGDLSLARVATVYRGEFGSLPSSPAELPVATSDPGIPSQPADTFDTSPSEPTVSDILNAKSMTTTDWLLVKVDSERAVASSLDERRGLDTPGDISPGLKVTFMSRNNDVSNCLDPQRHGIINGTRAFFSDCGFVSSEWVIFPPAFASGFAERGDSGGVVLDSNIGDPVGLIIAGHVKRPYVFVKALTFVFERIELLTGMKMSFWPLAAQAGPSTS